MQSNPDSANVVWQGYASATWMQRLAAHLIDLLLVGGSITMGILGLAIAIGSTITSEYRTHDLIEVWKPLGEEFGRGLFVVGTATLLIYAVWFAIRLSSGQTPGKQITGIRVVQAHGELSSWGCTFVRELIFKGMIVHVLTIITLGLFYVVNYLWPLWDKNSQTLHDKMAKTLVVQARAVSYQTSSASKPPPNDPLE